MAHTGLICPAGMVTPVSPYHLSIGLSGASIGIVVGLTGFTWGTTQTILGLTTQPIRGLPSLSTSITQDYLRGLYGRL